MASESAQDLQTADHFIYVTQVYFCGTYPSPRSQAFQDLTRGFCSHVYLPQSPCPCAGLLTRFLLDAVVLWDWIISLPREYLFVRVVPLVSRIHPQHLAFCRFGERTGPLLRLRISSAGKYMRRFDC